MPIMAFVGMLYFERGLLPQGGAPLSWTSGGMFVAMMLAILAVVAVFKRLFENNTDRLRAFLLKRPSAV